MGTAVLLLFCAVLAVCVATGVPTAAALAAGLAIFLAYGKYRGNSWPDLGRMCLVGFKNIAPILVAFVLIGMLTALWRGCGTIPAIVVDTSGFIRPEVFYLAAFLLNALLSVLTGTSFGTSATMGVITMAVGVSLGMDPVLSGGAVLAGAYVGDRCSPLSTSAMLVAAVTSTELVTNIKLMLRSAAVPFALACILYLVLGFVGGPAVAADAQPGAPSAVGLLSQAFLTGWPTLLPAAAVLVLPLLRVGVKPSMAVSIVLAAGVAVLYQGAAAADILYWSVFGYASPSPKVAPLLDGGGILGMANVSLVITISSCYAGIFEATGLLDGAKRAVGAIARATSPFVGCVCASTLTCAVSCNQSLSTMLTQQLCADAIPDNQELAIALEDSVIVIAALVPWCIASAVPLAAVGAPTASIGAAFFLYLVPGWRIVTSLVAKALRSRR